MKVALTGATGFVGAAALTRLIGAGHEVKALTRRAQPDRTSVEWVAGSLEDRDALAGLCAGADTVLHVAGVVGSRDPAIFEAGNVVGTQAVVDAAKDAGIGRFVHVSSLAAREPELSHYCGSKARAEQAVQASGLDWTLVRPPAVYGPGDTEMLDAYRAAVRGFVPMPPNGRMSLIHVDDLARLLVVLIDPGVATGAILEPDDGHEDAWSHSDYARLIGSAVGKSPLVLHMPAPLMTLAAIGDEMIRRDSAKLTRDRARYLVYPDWSSRADHRPDPALWTARIDSKDGIRQTAHWYRMQGWL